MEEAVVHMNLHNGAALIAEEERERVIRTYDER